MNMAEITFDNGVTINAEINGTCYITDTPIDEGLKDHTSVVAIKGETEETFTDMRLIECASVDRRYWFTFVQIDSIERLKADIDYLMLLAE